MANEPIIEDEDIAEDKPLAPRVIRYIEEYLIDFNGTRSAIAAGYSIKGAEVQSCRLLRNVRVMTEINRRQAEFSKKNKVTKDDMVKFLTDIKNADIKDYLKFDGKKLVFKNFDELTKAQSMAIEGIKMGKNGIELKLHGKSWAAEQLNKHLGTYEADNSQKTANSPRVIIQLPNNNRGQVVPIAEDKPKEDETVKKD